VVRNRARHLRRFRAAAPCSCLRNDSNASILFPTTVLLLSGISTDLVEDDAAVFAFNDRQTVVRTPLPRTATASTAGHERSTCGTSSHGVGEATTQPDCAGGTPDGAHGGIVGWATMWSAGGGSTVIPELNALKDRVITMSLPFGPPGRCSVTTSSRPPDATLHTPHDAPCQKVGRQTRSSRPTAAGGSGGTPRGTLWACRPSFR